MSDNELNQRLEILKADPPKASDEMHIFGQKMLELADLNMRLLDRLLAESKRS